jgi:hypothetical protein
MCGCGWDESGWLVIAPKVWLLGKFDQRGCPGGNGDASGNGCCHRTGSFSGKVFISCQAVSSRRAAFAWLTVVSSVLMGGWKVGPSSSSWFKLEKCSEFKFRSQPSKAFIMMEGERFTVVYIHI